ncbi:MULTISPECIES: hypothetical protein [Streptomyces]|uniref:Uncharacterized protein n=1 Tax=Streptomyces canarius TaxID=285453 RepID=A0ABQ3D0I2_9ACTN|nr:hypothetical protein [Streptomyces canarius]GHA49301.1 hypothetical protein GCM10010345_62310 [Streptomyces canarius]
MRQRHVFGTVFTLEAAIAGGVFLVVLAVPAWSLLRRRARTAERSERPRVEAFYVGALAAFAVFLLAWTAWQNHEEHPADAATPLRVDVITGKLPVGVAAAAVTWSWVNREEREALADEAAHLGGGDPVAR